MGEIGFGDNVRINNTPETEALGVAGRIGQVYGHTTPSITGVAVVGDAGTDYAINVYFDDRGDTLWFAPDLIQFVDHAPGTQIRVGGVSAIRDAAGNWVETPARSTAHDAIARKPWWRFW